MQIKEPRVLSIIIPTLDAAATLPGTISAVQDPGFATEVIVADADSRDGTRAVAEAAGARVIGAPAGRGPQLIAGAQAARGDWLLFLHADTVLEPSWAQAVAAFTGNPANGQRAGVFRFAFDDPAPSARRLERFVRWRVRALGLAYGDQGLLIKRDFYDALGGFSPLPLMEDVDLIRRIGRRRLIALDAAAVTSPQRYRRHGYAPRMARNLLCLSLYFLGLPPRLIVRIYG